jgi:hypothetical protein
MNCPVVVRTAFKDVVAVVVVTCFSFEFADHNSAILEKDPAAALRGIFAPFAVVAGIELADFIESSLVLETKIGSRRARDIKKLTIAKLFFQHLISFLSSF